MDALAVSDSETALADMLSAESKKSLRNHVQKAEVSARIECWLQQLSWKQREIICRRYGLRSVAAV